MKEEEVKQFLPSILEEFQKDGFGDWNFEVVKVHPDVPKEVINEFEVKISKSSVDQEFLKTLWPKVNRLLAKINSQLYTGIQNNYYMVRARTIQ